MKRKLIITTIALLILAAVSVTLSHPCQRDPDPDPEKSG